MADQIKAAFQGEVMLAGWKESHTGGATVTFWLPDPSELDVFRGMTARKSNIAGQRFMAVLVEIADDEKPLQHSSVAPVVVAQRRAPNELARRLHAEGYFRNAKLWAAMEASGNYTQAQHHEWIKTLSCCWPRLFPSGNVRLQQNLQECFGQVCGHHVHAAELPAAGSATIHPQKPPHWYEVPLCVNHHQNWVHAKFATREDKRLLLEYAVGLTADRMKAGLKAVVGIESLGEITQDMLESFERAVGFA